MGQKVPKAAEIDKMPKAKEVVKKAKKESKTKGQKIPEIDEKYGCFL